MRTFVAALVTALAALASPGGAPTTLPLEGTVGTKDGAPVRGALVSAVVDPIAEEVKFPTATTRTDGKGAFHLDVPAGTYMISAEAPGLAGAVARKVQAPAALVALTLGTGGRTLRGVVTTGSGRPVPRAWVYVAELANEDYGVHVAVTGEDGRYAVTLPPARYAVAARTADGLESPVAYPPEGGDATIDLRAAAEAKGGTPDEVTRWIEQNAIHLTSVVAGTPLDDMAPLRKTIGSARVVALGEATHGTREFFQLKHRMLEFLVEEMGFTVFAIEASMPDALAVDAYVREGKGDPAKALTGLGFWTWDTEEVLEMIRWMRRYNEDQRHDKKLRFYGFDMQDAAASADRLADYLKKVDDPAEAGKLLEPLAPLLAPPGRRDEPKPPQDDLAKVTRALDALGARLQGKKADYLAASTAADHALALQLVELLRQAQAVRWGDSWEARDRGMADNVRWILGQQPPGTRLVLWAHNGHISRDPQSRGGGAMGVHLEKALGPDYLTFGFAFERGSFQAMRMGKGLQIMQVGAPRQESLDAALGTAGLDVLALDLRKVPEDGPVAEWFDAVRPARSIGAVFEPSMEQEGYYARQRPQAAYDALLFVRNTTSARAAGPWAGRVTVARRDEEKPGLAPIPDAQSPVNLDFEADVLQGVPGQGWLHPTAEDGYRVGLDSSAPREGKQCARLERDAGRTATTPFGNLMQRISAIPYRGKKVKLEASVRSEVSGTKGQAQLWLRVDRENRQMGFFDNMQDRPIRDPEWKSYTIVGEVAPDAVALNFGVILVGEGRAWIDAVKLEVVDQQEPLPSANVRTRQLVQTLAFVCQAYQKDHPAYPAPPEGFVPADFLRPHLTPVYVTRIVDRDGWARPLLYASDGSRIAIVSYGEDGKPDRPYVSLEALHTLEGGEGDDIVWSGGHLVAYPAELRELEGADARKRTMADLRSIGLAVEAYRTDRGAFPVLDGYQPAAFLRTHIEPTYLRQTPLMDGWGNTLLYWSDGAHYRVVSPGADGTPDRPYEQVVPGSVAEKLESDLVFGDGTFLQGPRESGSP